MAIACHPSVKPTAHWLCYEDKCIVTRYTLLLMNICLELATKIILLPTEQQLCRKKKSCMAIHTFWRVRASISSGSTYSWPSSYSDDWLILLFLRGFGSLGGPFFPLRKRLLILAFFCSSLLILLYARFSWVKSTVKSPMLSVQVTFLLSNARS